MDFRSNGFSFPYYTDCEYDNGDSLFEMQENIPVNITNVMSATGTVYDQNKLTTFQKCLIDRVNHPNNEYHFNYAGINFTIFVFDYFSWGATIIVPETHIDYCLSEKEALVTYQIDKYETGKMIVFGPTKDTDYSLVREILFGLAEKSTRNTEVSRI